MVPPKAPFQSKCTGTTALDSNEFTLPGSTVTAWTFTVTVNYPAEYPEAAARAHGPHSCPACVPISYVGSKEQRISEQEWNLKVTFLSLVICGPSSRVAWANVQVSVDRVSDCRDHDCGRLRQRAAERCLSVHCTRISCHWKRLSLLINLTKSWTNFLNFSVRIIIILIPKKKVKSLFSVVKNQFKNIILSTI